MTREEAIKMLEYIKHTGNGESEYKNDAQAIAIDMAIKALEPEPCEDAVSRNVIIQKLNTMDRYVSEELRLCDTDKKFPKNEVFIVDDVYEEIVENLPSAQPEQRYTEEELRVFAHGISLSLLSKRSSQHWRYDEDRATEIKFLERLYEKVGADMRGEQPTIEPKRKKGKWIDKSNGIEGAWNYCSVCGEQAIDLYDFCPNCGADMRGEQDDESRSNSNAQTDTRARGMGTTDKSSGI